MKFTLGIRSQLTTGIVLITLAGIGLIGLLSIKIVENSAIYWKISEARSIARISGAALDPASSRRPSAGASADVLKEAGINNFRITGPSGTELIHEGKLPVGEGEEIPFSGDLKIKRIGGGWFQGPGTMLYVKAPLQGGYKGNGGIEFTVSLQEIRDDMTGVRKFLLFYALLDSVIIIVFGVYFLSRSIISPIRKLEVAATRIAGGKLGERADVTVDNEIGSLASSFNIMAERLEGEIKSLERVNLELLTTQEELLRSSTLAAVGRLAAGIAHEIGNPLGAVHGYLDILSRGLPDKDAEKEILERTVKEVSRIDSIVREFLETARPSRKATEPVDINQLLEETISSAALHRDFTGIETKFFVKEELPHVVIDEGKLRQVFMNLLINAAHSMAGKDGEKVISVDAGVEKRPIPERMRPRRRRDDPPAPLPKAEKEYVFIRFMDTGSGISDEDAGKIFDPFFTTKDVGKGTGLGLFVSQAIIKTYGGEISFTTGHGGSAFTVVLPSGREYENIDH